MVAREEESWGSTWDRGQGGSHWGGSRGGAGRGTGCYGAGKTGIRGPRGCSGRACRGMRVCRGHGGAAGGGDAVCSRGGGDGRHGSRVRNAGARGEPAGGGEPWQARTMGEIWPERPWGHGSGTLDICQRLWSGSSHPYGQRLGVDNRDTILDRIDACAERFIPPPGERCIPPPVNRASLSRTSACTVVDAYTSHPRRTRRLNRGTSALTDIAVYLSPSYRKCVVRMHSGNGCITFADGMELWPSPIRFSS